MIDSLADNTSEIQAIPDSLQSQSLAIEADTSIQSTEILTDSIETETVPKIYKSVPFKHSINFFGPQSLNESSYPSPFASLLDSNYISHWQNVNISYRIDSITQVPPSPPAWMSGKTGTPRHLSGGSDSGLLTIITLLMVVLALNFKYCPRIFANFADSLWSIRHRANVFDEHTTNETRVLVLMIFVNIAACSLLLYAGINWFYPLDTGRIFYTVLWFMGLIGGYYIFQLCAYSFVGYLFTDKLRRQQWVRGFNASQSLAGIALLIPALVTLFYPEATFITLIVAAGIYLLARIIFIAKGFRIFFNKITACFYFILYLCILEIIPALIVYKLAIMLVNNA